MTRQLRSFLGLLFLLCISSTARGQIQISPTNDTVCSNSPATYSIYSPSQIYEHFDWEVKQGVITSIFNNGDYCTILWGAPGLGTVIVNAWDTLAAADGSDSIAIVTRDTEYVTILPAPAPTISTDVRMACQPLDIPIQDQLSGFNDTGCLKVCAFNAITYTAEGDASSTYSWNVIGGSWTSTGNTCTVTWGSPGAGKITVQEINSHGCIGSSSRCIEIVTSPIAHFVSMPDTAFRNINICKGTEVIFIDYSQFDLTSPIVAWQWNFGDGNYSNEKGSPSMPISHTYNVAGSYTVSLTVTNQCGCSTTEYMQINVSSLPGVTITCPGVVCENTTYGYKVAATCPGGTWQVIGGSITGTPTASRLTVNWNNVGPTGFGYIIYNPGGSCSGGLCPYPVSIKIPVVKTVGTIKGPDHLCVNQQYMYTLPQWPSTVYNWTCNSSDVTLIATDQPNEIVVLPNAAAGAVTLTCNYLNTLIGCTGTATKTIQIRPPVVLDGPTKICEGGEFTYTLSGFNANTGIWKLVDPFNTVTTGGPAPAFSANFTFPGTYLLSVTGDFCPPEPLEIRIVPKPPMPESLTGPTRICPGIPTEYVAGTIDANNIFTWTLTNGTVNIASGSTSDITLNPSSTGPFILSVRRETKEAPHCQSDAYPKQLFFPLVNFSVDGPGTVCPNESYGYSVQYTEGESYDWAVIPEYMGSVMEPLSGSDGQGTPVVNVLWNRAPGAARVACRIKKCDTYYYDTLDVDIRSLDIHMTLPDSVCLYDFVNVQMDEDSGGIVWNTGLGALPGTGDFSYRYTKPVTTYTKYYVTGTVKNPYGCYSESSATDSIILIPAPYTEISPSGYDFCDTATINAPFSVTFDPAYPAPTSYQWSLDGTPTSTGSSYTATSAGHVWIHMTGPYGCPAIHEANVWTHDCPAQGPSYPPAPPGCPTSSVDLFDVEVACGTITAKSSHSPNYYYGYEWLSVLNKTSSTDSSVTLVTDSAGVYKLTYRALYTNTAGQIQNPACNYDISTSFTVPYVSHLEVKPTCYMSGTKRVVALYDRTSYLNPTMRASAIRKYYYGNTLIDSGYNEAITYTVTPSNAIVFPKPKWKLVVYVPGESECVTEVPLQVTKLPVASFTFARQETCEKDAAVKFTDGSAPTGMKTLWDFGDLTQNEERNPERVYASPPASGPTYDVTLTVTDPWGCTDDTTRPVTIKADELSGAAEITPRYPCQYDIATGVFQNSGASSPLYYQWYDMNQNKWSTFSSFNPTRSGGYYVHVEDQYGCYLDTKPDTVTFIRAPRAVIAGNTEYCRDQDFTLSGYVGIIPGLSYQWERNDTVIVGATSADLVQNLGPGTYKFNVTTTTPSPVGGFCSNRSDDFNVTINDTPGKPQIATPLVTNCNDYTVRLNITNYNANFIYSWSNGLSGNPVNVKHGGHYEVIVTDQHGCENKGQVYAPKDPREYLWIFPTGCYSLCTNRQNIVSGPIVGFTQWNYTKIPTVVASGSSSLVAPLNVNITGVGDYTMFLRNLTCSATRGKMTVDFLCTPGGPGIREMVPNEVGSLNAAAAGMQLAPNPAGNSTRVTYSYIGKAACALKIYDMVGREVYVAPLNGNNGVFDIDLSNFTPGIYKVAMQQGSIVLQQATLSITR